MILDENNCPKGWILSKVSDVLDVNIHMLTSQTDGNLPFKYVSIECVEEGKINFEKVIETSFTEAPGRARRILADGDLMFSTVRPNLKSFVRFKKPDNGLWIGSTGFAVAKAKTGNDSDFFFYQLLSSIGEKQFHSLVVGSNYPAINESDFKKLKVLVPPEEEQIAISSILKVVDDAIKAIENTIKSALKLKKSLMQNLLTGKLKPDGTWRSEDEFYKDEKFGDLPLGWVVKKGSNITDKITKGQSPKWQGFEYQTSGVLFVTSENVLDGVIDISSPKYLPIEFNDKIKNSQLQKGDILINIVGASIGRCAVYNLEMEFANTNQAVCVFRLNDKNDHNFIAYFIQLEHTQRRLLGNSVETARANLSLGDFRKFKFVLPEDKDEQILIANKINEIDEIYISKHQKVKTLQRLKKSLMQNLLTGKMRVDIAKLESALQLEIC
ncbi:hypothetical protein HHL17_09110 [Chitinophaga sp. G-6-1-13]|uniref:Type I restriction modification DNA specificity domain-containing protein n=1 Tax=Chitinophaga fulva TaxID=2728842 RepID=A0A848GGT3_9BACT|nr:restriction endonuclease subunit S [Chitinophaga fulva]NML37356.1 hypothetical protein [Chitinophaga fulva]